MEETKESYIRIYLGDFTVIDATVIGTPLEIETFIKDKNNKDAFLPNKGYVGNDIISIPVEVLWKNVYTLSEKREKYEFIIRPEPPI